MTLRPKRQRNRMFPSFDNNEQSPIRIGAAPYLNARPLTFCLERLAPNARIVFDLPSRLADALASARLDVALIPSIEYARNPDFRIVSDACVACDGPVRSVKLYGRVPPERIGTLALDEGSRTSAAITRIVLKERFGLDPQVQPLPIGASLEDTTADAVMLIGDRAMSPPRGEFAFVWDLGERWSELTGLPLVFAMWIARGGVDLRGMEEVFAAARDEGVARLAEIVGLDAPALGIPEAQCLSYLRDHLDFHLNDRRRRGLEKLYELAGRHGLAPQGVGLAFYERSIA